MPIAAVKTPTFDPNFFFCLAKAILKWLAFSGFSFGVYSYV